MNKHLSLLPVITLLAACGGEGAPAGQEAAADSTATAVHSFNFYGDTISADGAMDMAAFSQAISGKDSLDTKLACEITASCAKKGCWMDVRMADGDVMKVHFKDYAFFVPTSGLEGKQAIIQGRAVREITDVAALKHYAEDAGESPEAIAKITAPDTSWTFMADGVLIRN